MGGKGEGFIIIPPNSGGYDYCRYPPTLLNELGFRHTNYGRARAVKQYLPPPLSATMMPTLPLLPGTATSTITATMTATTKMVTTTMKNSSRHHRRRRNFSRHRRRSFRRQRCRSFNRHHRQSFSRHHRERFSGRDHRNSNSRRPHNNSTLPAFPRLLPLCFPQNIIISPKLSAPPDGTFTRGMT